MTTVVKEKRVRMHYRLVLENGLVVDSTGEEPTELEVGAGEILPGLEDLLIGLQPGDQREFAIEAGTMFPWPEKEAFQSVPRNQFPPDAELAEGQIYEFTSPSAEAVPGRISELSEETVTVDFNHPLAGKNFTFEVEILEVHPADE
ncbi:peptidylprolyl isomerase [Thioalkalivibrio sp. ALE23]|uniref:FKBP-type peptidyl-prolyl cis-trans isomerase n=1 Tax=Thioalkalivibrio sp. ALE23 TaxID=1265495 RepID=UPI00036C08D0|nr:FKBP-type peptidyl-prolyl cis-trans isomerase [Thioalkalivibrio sp. ALE23]